MNKNYTKYAFFDGDNISDTLEILLIEDNISNAVNLSEKLKIAMLDIETKFKSMKGVDIIILGGDDLLINYDPIIISIETLEEIRKELRAKTGISFSCGVGNSIKESIHHLYLAKLYGKDQLKF